MEVVKYMELDDLKEEYDKLQKKYGDEGLHSIYFGGCKYSPKICLVFMNPTSKNIASNPEWTGIRAPWIGTSAIWDLFIATNLIDEKTYKATKERKPLEWTPDFASEVYEDISKHDVFITNFAKCTQKDARPVSNTVYREYFPLLLKEIFFINPRMLYYSAIKSVLFF